MTTQSICSSAPVVSVVDNVVTALSTDVARYFEKPHNDVLKTIRSLINKIGGLGKNYQSSEYLNEQNKKQPCYRMDRKGFVLLAMGFTGEKALQFKIAYIDAFDEMEAKLQNSVKSLPLWDDEKVLQNQSQLTIEKLMQMLSGRRILLNFSHYGDVKVDLIPHKGFFTTHGEIPGMIRKFPDFMFPEEDVLQIAKACVERLEVERNSRKKSRDATLTRSKV